MTEGKKKQTDKQFLSFLMLHNFVVVCGPNFSLNLSQFDDIEGWLLQ
jgi:hypothetical protein